MFKPLTKPAAAPAQDQASASPYPMRINKYLAMKGFATRRGADQLQHRYIRIYQWLNLSYLFRRHSQPTNDWRQHLCCEHQHRHMFSGDMGLQPDRISGNVRRSD